jgi:hypothetical protein
VLAAILLTSLSASAGNFCFDFKLRIKGGFLPLQRLWLTLHHPSSPPAAVSPSLCMWALNALRPKEDPRQEL